jgi:uncharacterized protein (DUF1499 family)
VNPKSWLFDVFLVAAAPGTTPTRAGGGGAGGPLAPCPPTPNCVSSLPGESPARRVAPIPYALPLDEAAAAVRRVLARLPRTRIVMVRHDYLHAEFTSRLFRFVDDVEFYFDEAHKCLHVRSASRAGYWDFGVNRRRVEALRVRLAPVLAPPPAATQDAGLRP